MKQAAGRACATAARSAGMTTGSSSSRAGRSTSSPTGRSAGPPRPGAATTPNPPATPSSGPELVMKSGFARYRPGEIRELPQAQRSGSLCGDDPASGSGGVFEQVPVPDHPGGGTCPPGDGPERGGVTLVGCHLGLDGFGSAVADGVLDHLGGEVTAIGGGQLGCVQEVGQLGGAGGGIG